MPIVPRPKIKFVRCCTYIKSDHLLNSAVPDNLILRETVARWLQHTNSTPICARNAERQQTNINFTESQFKSEQLVHTPFVQILEKREMQSELYSSERNLTAAINGGLLTSCVKTTVPVDTRLDALSGTAFLNLNDLREYAKSLAEKNTQRTRACCKPEVKLKS